MKDTRTYILEKVSIFITRRYKNPVLKSNKRIDKVVFEQESYQKWAAHEFLNYISKSSNNLFISADRFIKLMDKFSCNGRNGWMFSIAHDVAEDILDYMYSC